MYKRLWQSPLDSASHRLSLCEEAISTRKECEDQNNCGTPEGQNAPGFTTAKTLNLEPHTRNSDNCGNIAEPDDSKLSGE